MVYETTAREIFTTLAESIVEKDKIEEWVENKLNNCIPQIVEEGNLYYIDGDDSVLEDMKFKSENLVLYKNLKICHLITDEVMVRWVVLSLNNLGSVLRFIKTNSESELLDVRLLYKGKIIKIEKSDTPKFDLWEVISKDFEGFKVGNNDVQHFHSKKEVERYLVERDKQQNDISNLKVQYWGNQYGFEVKDGNVKWVKESAIGVENDEYEPVQKKIEMHYKNIKELENKLRADGIDYLKKRNKIIVKTGKLDLKGFVIKSDLQID